MASFDEHINQAVHNLKFLEEINSKCSTFWDWQVTTTFYVAVHIVNAHLARTGDLHYRSHEDVKNALNPQRPTSVTKIDQQIYLSYVKLEGLSRRSRYLCHDNPDDKSETQHLTYDKHFAKAIRQLNNLLSHFQDKYSLTLPITNIKAPELSPAESLQMFKL